MNDTLLLNAAKRSLHYLEQIQDRPVAPDPKAMEQLAQLDEPLPQGPLEAADVLHLLDTRCSPATMGVAGPRFFGFVIGGSLPVTLAANWLAGAWDQNSALYQIAPGTAHVEQVALRWLLELFGLPRESAGSFVTGATVANFAALAAARHSVYVKAGWDIEGKGLIGAPPVTVVIGAEAHPSVFKSLGLLGLGRNRVVLVPVDDQGRMKADKLPSLKGPTIVCVQAGNVNTGAFDPIDVICRKAHDSGAWVHVDGAFGLWAAAAHSRVHLTIGMSDADSWATDAHKWLNVPYDSGLAFVRDRESLRAAMAITAEYLPTETEHRNPSDYVPELSRRARGVEIWAALKFLGRSGIGELIERTCRHARRFGEALSAAGFEILNDVVLNQTLVSFGNAETTLRVIADIQREGTCWAGSTVWQGRTAMRISVSSWATTDEDVEKSLAAMIRCARHHTK
jgi:glutamate/tyrosine decarboxylase-like PLP-dependent enzyme